MASSGSSGSSIPSGEVPGFPSSGAGTINGDIDGTDSTSGVGTDGSGVGAGTGTGTGSVLSSEEQVAILDGELDDSIAVFDGMILDERSTIQGIEDANPEEGLPEGGLEEPLFEEGDITEGSEGTVPAFPGGDIAGDPSGDSNNGDPQENNNRQSSGGSSDAIETARADEGIPPDLIDGSDDDIVARQIREAAIRETDPVLKEKLWEEYRKYKNQG